jgi:hypothetical protein
MLSTNEQKELFFIVVLCMAQQNKMKSSTKIPSSRRRQVTTLEQLSPEIFSEIFDYLTGNQIYLSFFGLNRQINELVHNTPNVHLDLSQTRTKFYHNYQRIFPEQNYVSVVFSSYPEELLKGLISPTNTRRLKSISLMDLPIYTFQSKISEIFDTFKHQLVSLTLKLMDVPSYGSGAQITQSFSYLLTKLPLLKYLALDGSGDIEPVEYMDSTIINNTVVSLTITNYTGRWVQLLYLFIKLKMLTIDFKSLNMSKRETSANDRVYLGNRISVKLSDNYSFRLRHVKIYQYSMELESVKGLFQVLISPSLLTLSLFNCQRSSTSYPQPKRQPPFLDGPQWHDLMKNSLPSTMKRFYIEYKDVDNTMYITNMVQVKKDFMKYSGQNLPWEVSCSYNNITKFLSFDFIII